MAEAPLPPGDTGLPILGETLSMLKNGFAFVEAGARKHGPIFQTKVFGKATAVISGPNASGLFIDASRVQRSGAMPPHIETLFAGRSLPLLDGDEHRDRKRLVMAAFTREALASYLPTMQRLIGESIGQWSKKGEVRLLDEFKRLAIETIAVTMLGLSRGPTLDAVLADYDLVTAGFASLPIPLPGTAFTRAKRALARILAVFETCVREHLASPKDDGLSRILAATTEGGRSITMEEVKRELHHIVVAGLIVWAWFVNAVLELGKRQDLRDRLMAEIRTLDPKTPLALETLGRMHELQILSMEIRRLSPIVFVFFGKAKETFEFEGYTVPKGWAVLWGHRSSHIRPEIYTEPEAFDPSRFSTLARRGQTARVRVRPERRGIGDGGAQVRRLRVRADVPPGLLDRALPELRRRDRGASESRSRLEPCSARAQGRPPGHRRAALGSSRHDPSNMLHVTPTIVLQDSELDERFVRASGPGGQNVNKVSTAVELRFNVAASALPEDLKGRLARLAGKKLSSDGVLLIDSREHRTQAQNRSAARARLVALLQEAAIRPKSRRKTRPSKAARERRLVAKSQRSRVKARRGRVGGDD